MREFLDEFALRLSDRSRATAIAQAPAAKLERRGVSAEMYVVGGAAIALAFDERDLPAGWLNDAVKGFLAGDDPAAAPVLDLPGLRCLTASPEMLLALKVLAHRIGEDEDDLRLLAQELGLERADQVLAVAERTFGDRLDPAARFFVEQIFSPE